MEIIKQDSQQKEGNQALMLKQYFVNLLIMELYEEVHNGDAADSVFKSTEPTQVLDNLWSKWQEAIAFLIFGITQLRLRKTWQTNFQHI